MKIIVHHVLCACLCAPVGVFSQSFSLLKDINPGVASSSPELMFTANGNLLFASNDGVHGKEVWKTTGIDATTTLLKDINPTGSSSPKSFAIYHYEYYFLADDGSHGRELWKTDGSSEGTVMLKDINTSGSIEPVFYAGFKELLFFFVDDGVHGWELWKTDGTTQGTQLIKDINPSGSAFDVNELPQISYFDSKLIFLANDGVHGQKYWVSDGTEAGTQMITDVPPKGYFTPSNVNNDYNATQLPSKKKVAEISALGSINGIGYTIVTDKVSGTELWVTPPPADASVSLLDFNGVLVGQDVSLNWRTNYEEKNSMYVLERSYDRINFLPVTSFAARNDPGTNSYQYIDRQIIKSRITNAYYRIRQIGPNRPPNYSKIVDIGIAGGFFSVKIQPNPVQTQLNIYINNNKSPNLKLSIFSNQGIVVTNREVAIKPGQQSISWDINKLAGGTYILTIQDGDNVLKEKFIKL